MKLIGIFFLVITGLVGKAQDFKELSWYDLAPKVEFDDPFTRLSTEQLHSLSQIAKYREKVAPIDTDSRIKKQTKIDSLEQVLIAESVNIDSLLSLRTKITELRKEKAETVNYELDSTEISISGYLLPLNYVDNKTTEFLLVPWVGACIHTPPPPKNQIVYLTSEKGYEVNSRFEAATIKGHMQLEDKTSLLFLVDGSDNISTGYSILDAEISKYEQ
ncbi:DUF3299 domain-containing protein [Prolixibacteraceae bacterium Z1-6]|uniref:DUF3299 domain-containing protein n=1 Tax=Draconibacterium aestuarii TaxID=2998507 RepID=A0A9X3F528_9BACT|nr:DUF3299 domain-containing protein [Prolixibacteraceae bacterium Z1-6]